MLACPSPADTRCAGRGITRRKLRDLEQTKASLEGIGDTRHLGAIRNKMKKLLVLPKEKSEAEREAHRLSQQRFYCRKKEDILEKRRRKRKRSNQRKLTATSNLHKSPFEVML